MIKLLLVALQTGAALLVGLWIRWHEAALPEEALGTGRPIVITFLFRDPQQPMAAPGTISRDDRFLALGLTRLKVE